MGALLSVGAASAGVRQATHPALKNLHKTPLIPIESFFKDHYPIRNFLISPDGKKLLWEDTTGGTLRIHFGPADGSSSKFIEPENYSGLIRWTDDSRFIVYGNSRSEKRNPHFVSVDTAAAEPTIRDLAPTPTTRMHYAGRSKTHPRSFLFSMNARKENVFDLYRLDAATGEAVMLAERHWWRSVIGPDDKPLLRTHNYPYGAWKISREPDREGGQRQTVTLGGAEDRIEFLRPAEGMDFVYAKSNRGRDKIALVKFDPGTGDEEVVYEHPKVDIRKVRFDPYTGRPLAVLSVPDHEEHHFLHKEFKAAVGLVRPDVPHRLRFGNASRDLSKIIVHVGTIQHGFVTHLIDRSRDTQRSLTEAREFPQSSALVTPSPFEMTARDGLTLHGYLTLPIVELGKPLPCVVYVHGGPHRRDWWGSGYLSQMLVNRGYGVLQINYRGSAGYGRRFKEAGDHEFGRKMFTDILDAHDWTIRQGNCDPKASAILGASYGGYSALLGATLTPERFKAVVSVSGMSDLPLLLKSDPPSWKGSRSMSLKYWGTYANEEDREELEKYSPINMAGSVEVPPLVIHGDRDSVVEPEQAELWVKRLRELGKDVDHLVLEGAGHNMKDWKDRTRIGRAVEKYLAERLGGRDGGVDPVF